MSLEAVQYRFKNYRIIIVLDGARQYNGGELIEERCEGNQQAINT
jgi:hypothetical protein